MRRVVERGGHTGLGNANDIVARLDGGNAILLDRGRDRISSKLNVSERDGMETAILELGNGGDANRALLEELDLSNPKTVS